MQCTVLLLVGDQGVMALSCGKLHEHPCESDLPHQGQPGGERAKAQSDAARERGEGRREGEEEEERGWQKERQTEGKNDGEGEATTMDSFR